MVKKNDLLDLVSSYREQIEYLKEEVGTLRREKDDIQKQMFILQDGILNIKAPEAYRDMRADEGGYPEESDEDIETRKNNGRMLARHLQNIESPVFKSVEDMEEALLGSKHEEFMKSEALHPNEES